MSNALLKIVKDYESWHVGAVNKNDTPRRQLTAEAANSRAKRLGFAPEDALADWFQVVDEVAVLPRTGQ
jgi:hypothetical protein